MLKTSSVYLFEVIPGVVVFQIVLDDVALLTHGNQSEIEDACYLLIDAFKDRPRLLLPLLFRKRNELRGEAEISERRYEQAGAIADAAVEKVVGLLRPALAVAIKPKMRMDLKAMFHVWSTLYA